MSHNGQMSLLERIYFGSGCPEKTYITISIENHHDDHRVGFFVVNSKGEHLLTMSEYYHLDLGVQTVTFTYGLLVDDTYDIIFADSILHEHTDNTGDAEYIIYEGKTRDFHYELTRGSFDTKPISVSIAASIERVSLVDVVKEKYTLSKQVEGYRYGFFN